MTKKYRLHSKSIQSDISNIIGTVAENFGFVDNKIIINWHNIVGEDMVNIIKPVGMKYDNIKKEVTLKVLVFDLSIWSYFDTIKPSIMGKIESITKSKCNIVAKLKS